MKRFSGKWLNVLLTVFLCMLMGSLAIADGTDERVVKVDSDSSNINAFAKEAPAVTIRINYAQLHDSKYMEIEYQQGYGFSTGKGNSPKDDGSGDFILYSPALDTKTGSLWPTTDSSGSRIINIKSSTNDPLFKFTFRDAAELANGETADVVVSYNNLTFYLRNSVDNGDYYARNMKDLTYYIASGVMFRTGTTSGNSNHRYGITADAHIDIRKKDGTPITEITTKDDGNPEPATFFYTVTDIDVWRPSHENFGKQLTSGQLHNYFSEQVTIYDESIYEKSDIYIPWQTDRNPQHLDHWERKQDTSEITFSPFTNYNDPETYYSGFATVINNARGLDLTVTSSGSGGATVRTWLYGRPEDQGKYIQHRIESESGRGGKIYTTEFGDPNKKVYDYKKGAVPLDSKDQLFDEGVYIFPDGKNVAYTMIPNEEGSTIREIEIYGDIKENLTTSKDNIPRKRFSKEELEAIPIGETYKDLIELREDRTGTLERLSDGAYRFTFNDNNHDHYIKVTWEKLISIPVQKEWEDEGNRFQNRPTEIVMNVFRNGEDYLSAKVFATDNWSYKFTDIPAWDENEEDCVYTVQESHVEGYQKGEVKRNVEGGFTVTNRLETTNIEVVKSWRDDTPADRPASISVKLKNGDDEIETRTLNDGNGWKETFTGLPTYRKGVKCIYTVEEDPVEGYYTEITPRDDHGRILITNQKLSSTIPTIHLRVQKYLNRLGAAGFTFQLIDTKTGKVLDSEATDSNGVAALDLNLTEAKVATYYSVSMIF